MSVHVKANFHWILNAAKSWNELTNILCLNLTIIVFDIFRINFYISFHYIAVVFWVQQGSLLAAELKSVV